MTSSTPADGAPIPGPPIPEPQHLARRQLRCTVCAGTEFHWTRIEQQRSDVAGHMLGLLSTRDAYDQAVCVACRHIEWFLG